LRLFSEIERKNPIFREFHDIPATLIDTTKMTNAEVYEAAWDFLTAAVPALNDRAAT